jgi:hypothetical protein
VRTRAFARIGIPASRADVEAVAAVVPGAAEWVLALVKRRAEEGGTGPLPPPAAASPGPPPAWVGATPSPVTRRGSASSPAYSAGSAGRAGGPAAAWVRSRLGTAGSGATGSTAPPPPALPSAHLLRRRAGGTPVAPSPWAPPPSSPAASSAGGGGGSGAASAAAAAAAAAAEIARLRAALRRLERVALLQEARIEDLTDRLGRVRGGSGGEVSCAHCGGAWAAGGSADAEGVPPPAAAAENEWRSGSGGSGEEHDENTPSPPRPHQPYQEAGFSGCGGLAAHTAGKAHAGTQRPSSGGGGGGSGGGWVAGAVPVPPPPPPPSIPAAGTPGPLGSSWAARPAAHHLARRWW